MPFSQGWSGRRILGSQGTFVGYEGESRELFPCEKDGYTYTQVAGSCGTGLDDCNGVSTFPPGVRGLGLRK
jgi:hypothetical protein